MSHMRHDGSSVYKLRDVKNCLKASKQFGILLRQDLEDSQSPTQAHNKGLQSNTFYNKINIFLE